jgi:hypothetical protein
MLLDFPQALQVLEIQSSLPLGPQPGIPAPAQGTGPTNTPGQLLIRARVKAVPAGVTEVPFECTVHKQNMTGKLVLDATPSGTDPRASSLAFVYNSFKRADPDLNLQPVGFPMPADSLNGVNTGDPVPAPIQSRFREAGDPRSNRAKVTVDDPGAAWTIKDTTGPTYPVRKTTLDGQDVLFVSTKVPAADPATNRSFPPTLVQGIGQFDPYTPLMRAYQGDQVQIRTLPGAHTQGHVAQVHGVHWYMEPTYANSGSRNAQPMGISQHYEFIFRVPPASDALHVPFADFFYSPSSGIVGLNNGLWGIMRAHDEPVGKRGDPGYLMPLPNNPRMRSPLKIDFADAFRAAPPARRRVFRVTATTVAQALKNRDPASTLVYNPRPLNKTAAPAATDSNAIIFVRSEDLTSNDKDGTLKGDVAVEPLILRAAAGDWIEVRLTNAVDPSLPAFTTAIDQTIGSPFNSLTYTTPPEVSLHPSQVTYDMGKANGLNVGFNPDQTVLPGHYRTFHWYAGNLEVEPDGTLRQTPVEFGTVNLTPADTQVQHERGLYGALVVEPEGSTWVADRIVPPPMSGIPGDPNMSVTTQASATVKPPDGRAFREFVVIIQNDALVSGPNGTITGTVNYRTEPFPARSSASVATAPFPLPAKAPVGFAKGFSDGQVHGDPATPVFQARAGDRVRFRVAFPQGAADLNRPGVLFEIAGHVWQDEPYARRGTAIGNNPLSNHFGMQQILPNEAYNLVLPSAGGVHRVTGDYVYQTFQLSSKNGTWGIFRVTP